MHKITDRSNQLVAYMHNNIILSTGNEIIGVLLGNCLFSRHVAIGKIINNKLHLTNGKIIGKLGAEDKSRKINEAAVMSAAWAIISQINNHSCNWIEELETWDAKSFSFYFGLEPVFQ